MNRQFVSAEFDLKKIKCVIFDFGFTLSSDLYFNIAPPSCPNWQDIIQQTIFSNSALVDEWMKGELSLADIAEIIGAEVDLDNSLIIEYLKMGCRYLEFNQAVLQFALLVREQGIKTAIVTGNMDVFSEVVVPSHQLDKKFDAIVNSCEYQELIKEILWPKAFELLGSEMAYSNSLLVEDEHNNVIKFRERGGFAYEYKNDELFSIWLDEIGWRCNC